jgi:hypothetical protein
MGVGEMKTQEYELRKALVHLIRSGKLPENWDEVVRGPRNGGIGINKTRAGMICKTNHALLKSGSVPHLP